MSEPAAPSPETPAALPLPHSMDAVEWATCWLAYVTHNPSIATDEGTMIGWFANAITAGFDDARRRYEKPVPSATSSSRTDAVKEAIAEARRHEHHESNCDYQCWMARKLMVPLAAALADAERKLACGHPAVLLVRSVESDYEHCQLCETRDRLRDALTMERTYAFQLAAAEKRAKDAEARADGAVAAYQNVCAENRPSRHPWEETMGANAAMTRQLVTAAKLANACHVLLDTHQHPPELMPSWQSSFSRSAAIVYGLAKRIVTPRVLAAIDAPAEEEEAPISPGGKCPECNATTCGTREVHMLNCSQADAPAWEGISIEPRVIDGKFRAEVRDGRVVIAKVSSGEIVPEDEPLFLLRGRDTLALPTLHHYEKLCEFDNTTDYQRTLMGHAIAKFADYASDPSRMKQPGITRGAAWNPDALVAERIKCSAIRKNGIVYAGPDFKGRTEQKGADHWSIAQAHPDALLLKDSETGFVTTTGRFVDRREGAEIALASGQIKELHFQKAELFSEDFNLPYDAPLPEPANAQESEAAHPFTAEEARHEARHYQLSGSRTAATLHRYADMLQSMHPPATDHEGDSR